MKKYIIQQKETNFMWFDVIETTSLSIGKKYLKSLREKHPNIKYRLVYWGYYV